MKPEYKMSAWSGWVGILPSGLLLCAGLLASVVSCSGDDGASGDAAVEDTDGTPDGDASMNPDAATEQDGGIDTDGSVPDADVTCVATPLTTEALRPRVMILLDQSAGMNDETSWQAGLTKWDVIRDALTTLLIDPANADVDFGLDAFPDGTLQYFEQCYDPCCANPACFNTHLTMCMNLASTCDRGCSVDLPPLVSMNNASVSGPAIIEYLNLDYLPGIFTQTPLLQQLLYYTTSGQTMVPELFAGDGLSYLLLIGGGPDTCDAQGAPPDYGPVIADLETTTLQLQSNHEIRSYVVGWVDSAAGTQCLEAVATNGGTPHSSFFPVQQAGDLANALDTVSAELPRCMYKITNLSHLDPTTDFSTLSFAIDGSPVSYEEPCIDGWHYGTSDGSPGFRVQFCGASCTTLTTDASAVIQGDVGCP